MSHAITQVPRIEIRCVLAPRQPATPGVGLELASSNVEKRTQEIDVFFLRQRTPSSHSAERVDSQSSKKRDHDSLDLIIVMVCGRDRIKPEGASAIGQPGVARGSCAMLDRCAVSTSQIIAVETKRLTGKAAFTRERFDERRVGARCIAESVIDVKDDDFADADLFDLAGHRFGEADRVEPPGHGESDSSMASATRLSSKSRRDDEIDDGFDIPLDSRLHHRLGDFLRGARSMFIVGMHSCRSAAFSAVFAR